MKKLSYLFFALALVLSHLMCWTVAYNYRGFLCGSLHEGFSAPASLAFLGAIPYCIGIALCLILAVLFRKKAKKSKKDT